MIEKYQKIQFDAEGISHDVYVNGSGPPVVLMHEIPGMTVGCLRVSQQIIDAGFTVHLPLFFGQPERTQTVRNLISTICIRREFNIFTSNGSSPISAWLRQLCRKVSAEKGGSGVGLIGMCFTGNVVLSVMLEPAVRATAMCEPALPFFHKAALGVPEQDLIAARTRAQENPILAYRFSEDDKCPRERFATLRNTFGAGIRTVEFPSGPGNPFGLPQSAHSVLTNEFPGYLDPNHPTHRAFSEILANFKNNLR
jgi:dienelactone hydrolase